MSRRSSKVYVLLELFVISVEYQLIDFMYLRITIDAQNTGRITKYTKDVHTRHLWT